MAAVTGSGTLIDGRTLVQGTSLHEAEHVELQPGQILEMTFDLPDMTPAALNTVARAVNLFVERESGVRVIAWKVLDRLIQGDRDSDGLPTYVEKVGKTLVIQAQKTEEQTAFAVTTGFIVKALISSVIFALATWSITAVMSGFRVMVTEVSEVVGPETLKVLLFLGLFIAGANVVKGLIRG